MDRSDDPRASLDIDFCAHDSFSNIDCWEGHRLLAAEEDLAFELLQMLDPQQRARASIAAQTFGDIVTRSGAT